MSTELAKANQVQESMAAMGHHMVHESATLVTATSQGDAEYIKTLREGIEGYMLDALGKLEELEAGARLVQENRGGRETEHFNKEEGEG